MIEPRKVDFRTLASKYWLELTIGVIALLVLIVGVVISQRGTGDTRASATQGDAGGTTSTTLLVLKGGPAITLDYVNFGSSQKPGHYKKPYRLVIPLGNALSLSGWAIDQFSQESPGAVIVQIDEFNRVVSGMSDRTDVAKAFGKAEYTKTGYSVVIPPVALPLGHHRLAALVENQDHSGYYVDPDWIDVDVVPKKK